MDLDRSLLRAMLASRDAWDRGIISGITAYDLVDATVRRAWLWVQDYVLQHGTVPAVTAVERMCDLTLDDDGLGADYIFAEVQNRRLFRGLWDSAQDVLAMLKGNDPQEAMRRWLAATDDLRSVAPAKLPDSLVAYGAKVLDLYRKVSGGYTGYPLPWPTINEMTMGLWPGTLTVFVGRPGQGKCLRHDTLVMCAKTGIYRSISDIVRYRERVLTRHLDGRVVPVTPDAFLPTGRKECLRVVTHGGRTLSGTPEHPLWTVDGWKRLDELAVGDYVAIPRVVPEPEQAIDPGEYEPELIAALLADGGLSQSFIGFAKSDRDIVSRVQLAVEAHGAVMASVSGMPDNYRITRPEGRSGRGENPIAVCLRQWGVARTLSKHKTIPDRVFQYTNEALARFLGMMFSCDGSFPWTRHRDGTRVSTIEITLASREMIYQIQRLLLRFGIHGSIRHKRPKCGDKRFNAWVLTIFATCYQAFREQIPITGKKKEAWSQLQDAKNPNVDNVPITTALTEKIKQVIETYPPAERAQRFEKMRVLLGRVSGVEANKLYRRRTVSARLFASFVDAFDAEELRPILRCVWDRIKQIEPDGVHDVYDLTVFETHSFIANDMVVHNTMVLTLIAQHLRQNGHRVLIVSPEMSKLAIAERFLAAEANVSFNGLLRGTLTSFEVEALERVVAAGDAAGGLWIVDASDDLSTNGLEAVIRGVNPEVVLLDTMYNLRIKGDRFERTEGALDWLGRASQRFQFATVAFSQLNRNAEMSAKQGGGIRLGTLAFSDQVAMDAHAIYALHQDKDMLADRRMQLLPLKLRRGFSEGPVEIHWDFRTPDFSEVTVSRRSDAFVDEDFQPTNTAATEEFPF